MGGTSGEIDADNLIGLLDKFAEVRTLFEEGNMGLDGVTIIFKDEKGKLMAIGNNGIELATSQEFSKKPTKKFRLCYHFHS